MLPITLLSLAIWLFLLLFWGNFWKADQRLDKTDPPNDALDRWPSVWVVIPARNEAEVLPVSLRSHLTQTYPGHHHILLVDDQSTDGTRDVAQQIAAELNQSHRLTVLEGKPLPPGWTGKLWAMEQGYRWLRKREISFESLSAEGSEHPGGVDYVLFTDADIAHGANILKALVVKAEQEQLDLTSLMVLLRRETFWETLLIPAFVFFFQMLYPFPWVNSPERKTAGAAGGCMLLRTTALERIGGVDCIRDALIDDCSLGAAVKAGGPIWLGLAEPLPQQLTPGSAHQTRSASSHGIGSLPMNTAISLRAYPHLQTIWDMVARTAYTQLRYSPWLLAGSVVGMALVYLMGPVALLVGIVTSNWMLALLGGACWGLMALAYWPMLKLYRCSPVLVFALPVIALFYTLMTIDSALRHWQGKGGAWKGRTYSAAE
jgi:hopene-associated glycosyltransferase HpnB